MTTANGLNVAIATADEIVRSGIAAMLRNLDTVRDVSECRHADDLAELSFDKVDVLVLRCAADEPWQDAAEAARRHAVMVIVLLDDADGRGPARVAGIPAHGFLRQQGLTAGALGDMLARLGDGHVVLPTRLAQEWLGCGARPAGDGGRPGRPTALTPREHEVLSLLAHGLLNKQIARNLRISEHGAKRLVGSVLTKLSCSNRTLAVAVALREGLLDVAAVPGAAAC
jgi:two-component system nitrate/nitrite response regulator NarL